MTSGSQHRWSRTVGGLIFLVTLLFCLSLIWDDQSRIQRGAFFLCTFVIARISAAHALMLLIGIAVGFEIPTLLWGLPNQFIIEAGLTGFIASQGRAIASLKKGSYQKLAFYPLYTYGLFLVAVGTWGSLWGFMHLLSFSDYNEPKLIVNYFFKSLHHWDVGNNPFHPLTLAYGYLIHALSIMGFIHLVSKNKLTPPMIMRSIAGGAIYVFSYACLQMAFPHWVPIKFADAVSGPFQNSNHLSFYGGYTGLIWAASLGLSWMKPRVGLPLLMISIVLLIIGQSKTAWLAFAFTGGLVLICNAANIANWLESFSKVKVVLFLTATVGAFVWLGNSFLLTKSMEVELLHLSLAMGELFSGNILEFLGARDRSMQIIESWNWFAQHPLVGLGMGNFFVKSQLGYENHNAYLLGLSEMGLGGLIATLMVVALTLSWIGKNLLGRFKEPKPLAQRILIVAPIIYLGICLTMDIYISYRSIAFLVGVVFVLLIHTGVTPHIWERQSNRGRFILFWGVLALTLSILGPIFSPPIRLVPQYAYMPESITDSRFSQFQWHTLVFSDRISPGNCSSLWIMPYTVADTNIIKIGMSNAEFPRKINPAALDEWERSNLEWRETIEDRDGSWHKICQCLDNSIVGDRFFYVRSLGGGYPKFSQKSPSADLRFLGFASAGYANKLLTASDCRASP